MNLTAAIIGPAHGLRGEVLLDIRTDDAERVVPSASFETDSSDFPVLTVVGLRQHKGRTLAIFDEIASREDAEAARGIALLTEEHDEDNAWYPHQLVGLAARSPEGESLGEVTGLQPGAAQDLLLVRYEGRTVMVPFVHQLVPVVDVEAGVVIIDAPGGLFDDDFVSTRD
ncbi:ribosome maturation factor RimM [Schaalia sp. Marseille-Q2122]|uniref:ribosome maturation factor RimM n=1 Tax=Schaalia sp. Marseille-Q2122 TaxID=2736604 RepID=UPI00158DF568|nr:ribosome maturation factor RimM [Schaalia sp. Marseille-Q2122]